MIRFSTERVIEALEQTGVPIELWDEACKSVREGYVHANGFKQIFHNLTAPLVVPFALLTTKWEDEEIACPLFSGWNNDASINGDMYLWPNGYPITVPLEKDSKVAVAMNYWFPDHHPRSFLSRYVWLGLRNRGKQTYLVDTEEVPTTIQTWGENVTRGDQDNDPVTGWCVQRCGTKWVVIGVHKSFGEYYQETRWGWKIGLWEYYNKYFGKNKLMAVGVNYKFRKRNKD